MAQDSATTTAAATAMPAIAALERLDAWLVLVDEPSAGIGCPGCSIIFAVSILAFWAEKVHVLLGFITPIMCSLRQESVFEQ